MAFFLCRRHDDAEVEFCLGQSPAHFYPDGQPLPRHAASLLATRLHAGDYLAQDADRPRAFHRLIRARPRRREHVFKAPPSASGKYMHAREKVLSHSADFLQQTCFNADRLGRHEPEPGHVDRVSTI